MKRLLLAAALLTLTGLAGARSLAREGTVAILPTARFAPAPKGFDGAPVAPALGLSFGFKPEANFEIGIDIGGSLSEAKGASGTWDLLGAPLLLRFSWTPLPHLDLRPVLHAGVGKALVTVDGPSYREHTPYALQATAGLQADLSDTVGLWLDGGYLYARAEDPALGTVDAGGILARAGLYCRGEPIPKRGF